LTCDFQDISVFVHFAEFTSSMTDFLKIATIYLEVQKIKLKTKRLALNWLKRKTNRLTLNWLKLKTNRILLN
jgi:hypothetical protein